MSYSRRQLYAFGEPLGDGATHREVGGKIIYGGGGDSTPEKQTTVVDIPDWAKPYAKESLGKAAALTSTPYQTYGGERIAQFTPMQKQAFGRAEGQEVASQIGAGSGLAGTAGLMGLTGGYQPGQFGSQMSQYMSPYMDAVVQQQMESAQRQADIAGTQRGAQAVRAGAFGGSRQAIENAEAARALASQKGQIQATGLQSAYDRATDMYGREQALAEQSRQAGLGTALTAAGQLGQLGGQQFGQEMDITGQKFGFGQQQRAATQDILSQQYQDFQNQQRAPYDQLSFMSSMIRGTPLGQTTTMYAPPPSTTSQLIGLGTAAAGAYGAYKGAAGGEIPSYAAGGITSLLDDVDSLSDDQLGQMQQGQQRPLTAAAVAEEVMRRQEMREGMAQQQAMMATPPQTTVAEEELAGLSALPAPNLENMDETTMAGGGIVAFQSRGAVPEPEEATSPFGDFFRGIGAFREARADYSSRLGSLRDRQAAAQQGIFEALTPTEKRARAEELKVIDQEIAALEGGAASSAATPVVATPQITPSVTRDEKIRERQGLAAIAPTTKEAVDRETPGAAPAGGLGALVNPRGFYDKNRQDIEALGAEEKAFAEQEAEAVRKDQEAMGQRGTEKKKRLEEDMAGLKGKKDQNFNMALIEAGLAMMAGDSANAFENIGKGALIGTKAFTEGTERLNREKARLDDALSQLEDLQFSDEKANKAELRKAKGAVKQAEIGTKKALANLGIKETETVVDLYKTGLEIGSRERIAAAAATKREGGAPDYMDAYLKQYLPKFAGTDALGNTMTAPSYEEYLRTIGIYNRPTEGAKVLPAVK